MEPTPELPRQATREECLPQGLEPEHKLGWTKGMAAAIERCMIGAASGSYPEHVEQRYLAYTSQVEHTGLVPCPRGKFSRHKTERWISNGFLRIGQRDRVHANTDPLTKLLNRRGLDKAVRELVNEVPDLSYLALVMLDLDGFKGVNDSQGHAAGDDVLRRVAGWLQDHTRAEDSMGICSRVGGDEFIILLNLTPCSPKDEAGLTPQERLATVVERLRTGFNDYVTDDEQLKAMRIGVSIGAELYDPNISDTNGWLDTVIARADKAMYADKARNR